MKSPIIVFPERGNVDCPGDGTLFFYDVSEDQMGAANLITHQHSPLDASQV
jgi:hypothetical protein